MLNTMQEIRSELRRVDARNVRIRMDREFEPDVGDLLEVSIDSAYWHMLPADFLQLVRARKQLRSRLKETANSYGTSGASIEGYITISCMPRSFRCQ